MRSERMEEVDLNHERRNLHLGSSEATKYWDNRGAAGWSCGPRVPCSCPHRALPAQRCHGSALAQEQCHRAAQVRVSPSVARLCSQMPITPRHLSFAQSSECPLCGGHTGVTNA